MFAQSVLDPNDPIVEYDATNPPVQPPYGQIGKWVRTKSLSWNSDSYKCYIYEGSCFRLKFPKTYNPTANDGKKYPLAILFHGAGEAGPITDNESQLYHGGPEYKNAVDNGSFDGYVLFMQSQGLWGITSYARIIDVINYMITNNKLDPFRISVNGLSSGGQAAWDMIINYPNYVTASLPMSSVSIGYKDPSVVNKVKFTPMWDFQGELDGSPDVSTAQQVRDAMINAGGNYRYTEYQNTGHNTWDSAFIEPDFFPFMSRGYASNPWPLFGRTGFCPGNTINVTLGVAPGYNSYQWRKDSTVIQGATSNTIIATSLGTYDARVLRGSIWSDWSHIPVVLQITPPTVTPPIRVSGLMSNVLISGDGKNYVNLEVPDSGYTSYTWKKVGSDSVIGTQRIYTATQTGQYIVAVTQQYGCSSIYSPPFAVVNANGLNAPDAASKLTATTLSSTEIVLNWENNPHPLNNETFFEIYRSTSQSGAYSFIGKAPADVLKYEDSKLSPGLNYYYKIRAINNNGAAAMSNIANASTQADQTPPSAPGNLRIKYATNSSISIIWNPSTDNVGVANYDIYINNVKSYTTSADSFIVNALQQGKQYTFYVKAKDSSNNYSVQSNLASSPAVLNGLMWKYYEGYWEALPDFNTLNALDAGVTPNIDLSVKKRLTLFGILWQGFLNVPVTGTYRFSTTSDDGSRVWLNAYDPSIKPLVDNDHVNAKKTKPSTNITLQKGLYPISIAYYQNKNGRVMELNWTCPALFGDSASHPIEDKYFVSNYVAPDSAPKTPTNLTATALSSSAVKLSWSDKSNNETGFQIYRSAKTANNYTVVFTTQSNITSFTDSNLVDGVKYYYFINAVNNYGASTFTSSVTATTLKLPLPKAPTLVKAKTVSSSSIQITWNDIDTTETNYQVLRSVVDTFNFKPAALLPANSTSFTDSALYGNTNYYYKVNAIRGTASSVNKPAVTAKTSNNGPLINNKFNQKNVPYGVQTNIQVTATDSNADPVTFTAVNLPSFANFTDNGNGMATISFNPTSAQQGNYQNIKIVVKDSYNASDTDVFTLTVNNNFYPVIDTIADYTLNEGDVLTIPLSASDQNSGDALSWSVNNIPNNYSIITVNNSAANLVFKPTYGASGVYKVVVTVNDGNGGACTRQFNITVNDKDPTQVVYLRFKDQDVIGSPWNNLTAVNSLNFKDNLNRSTSLGLSMQTSWWATWHEGPNTGNNSGIYPDAVMKDYYYFGNLGGPQTVTSKITGLDTSKLYSVSFYGGSVWSGASNNGTTIYSIGSQSIPLNVQNNTTATADFDNTKPAADGTITFTMSKGSNTPSGYINAIVIKSVYTDTAKPAAPTFLAAADISGTGVRLTWNDNAYNETNYNVYRAVNATGPFVIITGKISCNTTNYLDTSAAGNTQYYYYVKASSLQNISDSSNVVSIQTSDRVPVITPIPSITIKNNQQQTLNIITHDDASDHVSLSVSNLPSFVTFTDNGNGTGLLQVTPSNGITGTFENITVTATDNSDSVASTSFNITVTDQNITSVYVNFSSGSLATAPWNNLTAWPFANTTISNLIDDNNTTTSISLKLKNGFQGNFAAGMQPGNNKGVYPEVVMKTGEYESSTKTDSIQVSGLAQNKKYNFVFFNSHDDGNKGVTNFTINSQTVSLNATHNINTTAEINGVTADANGQVMIKVAKGAGSDYAYINSLIIQSFDNSLTLLPPSDLRVTGITKTSVKLQWADKSSDETGFEIWKATDSNSTYTLLKTVTANVTGLIDSDLIPGHNYYYTVRAVNNSTSSAFCNAVSATTYSQVVYVNFTYTNNANTPWNNTLQLPQQGLEWNNFYDDTGVPSSISMQETSAFAGLYGAGVSTGNNSGIFPDKVLIDSYGLFVGESGSLKITGLNINSVYDFTFFASSQAYGDVNSLYTVNGKKGVLNASLNTDGTVTVYNIVPDKNGEAVITISPNSFSSQYGLIGALIMQEYTPNNNSIPSPKARKSNKISGNQPISQATKSSTIKNAAVAYPNPFNNDFTLSISLQKQENVQAELYDINGKLILRKNFGELQQGSHELRIIPGTNISRGMYVLKIIYRNTATTSHIKVLKQ
ncbi:MAG: fibronectin type III domain-containing protein [Parafilimonas sp.]|nr:fibronectin type III domain-containing protein [Parafilimonas sp.]